MGIFDTGFTLNPSGSLVPFQQSFAGLGDFSNIASVNALDFLSRNPTAGAGGVATPVSGPSWWDGIVGGKNADGSSFNGLGGLALGTLQGFGNLYGSMKNYGLAKEDFEFKKAFAEKNLANQTQLVNNQIRDRNNARNAANPNAYQPISLLA